MQQDAVQGSGSGEVAVGSARDEGSAPHGMPPAGVPMPCCDAVSEGAGEGVDATANAQPLTLQGEAKSGEARGVRECADVGVGGM
jgi:hypothetical protein